MSAGPAPRAGSGAAPLRREHSTDHLVNPPKRVADVELAQADTALGALRAVWTRDPRAVTVSLDGAVVAVLTAPALLGWVTLGRDGADGPALALRGRTGSVRWRAGRFSRARMGRARTLHATVDDRTWEVREDHGTLLVERGGTEVLTVSDRQVAWTGVTEPDDLAVGVGLAVTSHRDSWTTLTEKLLRPD